MAEMTPMMRQYFKIKDKYKDSILMFRLGDFYEMFFDDAKTASRELELVLTGRDCGQEERAPMCGVPFHSADSYIARLIAKGYKVAICEQTEDPSQAKGLVERDVVRVLTPGTVIESSMLDESKNNFLCCLFCGEKDAAVCFADISTGEVHLTFAEEYGKGEKIIDELGKFMPSEIIYNSGASKAAGIAEFIRNKLGIAAEGQGDDLFSYDACAAEIIKHFGVNAPDDIGISAAREAVCALGATLLYLRESQKSSLSNIRDVNFYSDSQFMRLDVSSRRNLELTETMRSREKQGTLLWALDKTKTPMGKRLIRSWIEQPLISVARITRRHNAVGELLSQNVMLRELRDNMSDIRDMERLMARIVYGTANAKELKALEETVRLLPFIAEPLKNVSSELLKQISSGIDMLDDVGSVINAAIVDDPPFSVREGGMIRCGFNSELDSLREIVASGKGFIASIQTDEQEKTGIKKLKIGYNRVFGYYIEVPNSFSQLVPDEYIRKQTLVNCERYITQELKELEAKVLGAQDRITGLEYEIFNAVRSSVADELHRIQRTAHALAQLDALCSFAYAAGAYSYVCPEINAGDSIEIKEGRHPVVELMQEGAPFVPNDTVLDCTDNRCAIITGPNMAGKSTYMRQVALILLMAQSGSFVPASAAKLGVVDSIFTRVGASDDLASGQSTFMVEMSEVASILKNATSRSLIVFDEIGRGTSTFDGMSIARAVLEYAADKRKLGAKTLFATHYHELTELENETDGVKNYNVSVKKRGDDITFLRRIVRGGADGSYGIEVAKLAGVPASVVSRAKTILRGLESDTCRKTTYEVKVEGFTDEPQISFESNREKEIIKKLKAMDVNTLTPIEALSKLYEIVNESKNI